MEIFGAFMQLAQHFGRCEENHLLNAPLLFFEWACCAQQTFHPNPQRVIMKKIVSLAMCFSLLFVASLQAVDVHSIIPIRLMGDFGMLAFSSDGTKLAMAGNANTVQTWDVVSGRWLHELVGHTGPVCFASFSPDGRNIVTASFDQTARIWDVDSAKEIRKLEGHIGYVRAASFSLDGAKIVTAGTDRTVRIWDAKTGKELKKFEGHTGIVWDASFSPDGTKIVTGSSDKTSKIWDAKSGLELKNLEGHTGEVRYVAFSLDGKTITTAGRDGTVRIWDAELGLELKSLAKHEADFLSNVKNLYAGNERTTPPLDLALTEQQTELKGRWAELEKRRTELEEGWAELEKRLAEIERSREVERMVETFTQNEESKGRRFFPQDRRFLRFLRR
jgi:WD40 repeat protein